MDRETDIRAIGSRDVPCSGQVETSGAGAPTVARVLYLGENAHERAAIAELLDTVVTPRFVVCHARDASAALEQLKDDRFDALVVELVGDRRRWIQVCRSPLGVPVIAIDYDGATEDRVRLRAEVLREGASAYLRRADLSGAHLETAIFGAVGAASQHRALRKFQDRFAMTVQESGDGVWEWVLATGEMCVSGRWRNLFDFGGDNASNHVRQWFDRVHPDDVVALRADIDAHLAGQQPFHEHQHRIRAGDGRYQWVVSRAVAQRQGGRVVRMVGSMTEAPNNSHGQEGREDGSGQDRLTALPGRELFVAELSRAIARVRDDASDRFAVLMVDVDRYRWLADSIGDDAANAVIAMLAKRLLACVRPGDVIARFSGDRFAVLLKGLGEVEVANDIANRIRIATQEEPFEVHGQTVYTAVSTGLTTSERGYKAPEEVLSEVAAAANEAKTRGAERHEVIEEPKPGRDTLTTLRLEVALRQAVERDQFELNYQPIVDLHTGDVAGFEALTRWRHPRRGLVSPTEFIPIAEQTGLILPIGRWAIRESLRQLGRWQDSVASLRGVSMSVNLSGRQITDPRLLEEIDRAIEQSDIHPGTLRLELTESVLIDNAETVRRILGSLRRKGVRIWVDDFGTGYSSLSYLHRFPIDGLKIDKAFVDALDGTDQSGTMIRTILSLAKNLNVDVIAEGIEREVQAAQLLSLGCRRGQGFLYGRPLEASTVARLAQEVAPHLDDPDGSPRSAATR